MTTDVCTYCERPLTDVSVDEHRSWSKRGLTWWFCSKPCLDDFLIDAGYAHEVVFPDE